MSLAFDLSQRYPCTWGECDRVFLSQASVDAHVGDHETGKIPERRPELACRHCRSLQDTLEGLFTHSVKYHNDPTQGTPNYRKGRGQSFRFRGVPVRRKGEEMRSRELGDLAEEVLR